MMPRELSTERGPELLGKNLPGYPVPALVRRGCPRAARAGAARSVSPIGRNIKGLFKDEQYRLIRSASRASIRWLRVFEQTTPALRACPSLLRRGMGQNQI